MDSASSSRKLEFCDDGHTFTLPPDQLPKHKIFISHSGKQKDFAEQLCEDLERWGYYPFFDKRPESLPKGEHFPSRIFEAARDCFLAILLLSEEFFTRSKWPMLELASIVEAKETQKHLQILPVVLDPGIGDLKDTARWSEHWKNWGKQDNRVDCKKWETAVQSLRPVNMLMKSSYDGEVALRKAIVQAVVSMMPPDIQSDVAHVQDKERLYKEIVSKFSSIPTSCSKLCENAKVLGVYGIVGAGKSTLCMILTHFLRREFQGRVCHVELDEGDSTLQLQHRALKRLTGANQDYLNMHINTKEEGLACLKERIPRQRVFLALDNVSDIVDSSEAATMFLKPKFYPDSMVLVTSRSIDVLISLKIPESCCMPCPHITLQEALKIVSDHLNFPSTGTLTDEQKYILHRTLDLCNFGGFHPLSLKLLASQMGSNPVSWILGDLNLQKASDILFSALPDQQTRDIFMDIALFSPEKVTTVHDVCTWLSDTLHSNCDINHIKKKLKNLRLKSLLEVWNTDSDIVRMHVLHRELAKRKVSDGNSLRFVYQRGNQVHSKELSIIQLPKLVERAGFVESSFTTLRFEERSRLQLLCIRSCEKLATLCLHGLLSLVSLELISCPLEFLNLEGLVNLRWLCVDSCGKLMELDASGLKNLTSVSVSRCIGLEALILANTNMLKSLSVSYNSSLEHVDLGSGQNLQCLTLWFCEILTRVDLSESVYLCEFRKRGCPWLLNIQGCINVSHDVKCFVLTRWHNISSGVITALEGSTRLQVLDLWDCPASRLPDLRGCSNLCELRFSDLDVLLDSDDISLLHEYADILCASSEGLGLPAALQDLQIVSCRNVVVKEVCWKLHGLKNLVVLSLQRVRVAWDWELYRSIEQKGSNTSFQASLLDDKMSGDPELEALHADIDIYREAEMARRGEEERSRSEEASSDNGDLSAEVDSSNEEMASSSEEATSDNADLSAEVDSSNEGLHKGATMTDLEIFNCLCQIMYWVQEYLKHTWDLKKLVQVYRERNMMMAASEDIGLCWERMIITSDRFRDAQYGIIERTLLETCNSCDTICEQFIQKNFVQESLVTHERLDKADRAVNVWQMVAAEWLHCILRAISPQGILMHDDLEIWEEEIIDELVTYEKVRAFGKSKEKMLWENRLMGEGIILDLPLTERLQTLAVERGWALDTAYANKGLKQWRGDWLRSCKIGILIEQLNFLVERRAMGVVDEGEGRPSNFQWLGEMINAIDRLLRREMINAIGRLLRTEMNFFDELASRFEGMLRVWKTRHWLRALASALAVEMQGNLIQENKPVTDRMQSINQSALAVEMQGKESIAIDLQERESLLYLDLYLYLIGEMSSLLKHSESLANMLREELEFAGESWERALKLASDLVEVLDRSEEMYRKLRKVERRSEELYRKLTDVRKKCTEMERMLGDVWEWAGRWSFQERMNHVMSKEQILMQLSKEAVPEREILLSIIKRKKQDAFVAAEEDSAFWKLIQHFECTEQVHWSLFLQNRVAHEAAKVKLLLMERVGKMRALMTTTESGEEQDLSSSEQQPQEVLKGDELQMWRRAGKFPLRKIWSNINRDQNFLLPITNCSMLSHLHISNCTLGIPPDAEPHIKSSVAST